MDVKRWTCSVTNAFPVFWGSMFILDRMYKIKDILNCCNIHISVFRIQPTLTFNY